MRKQNKESSFKFDPCKSLLERMYKEAKADGRRLHPDEAMRELNQLLINIAKNQNLEAEAASQQIDPIAYWRELHIHAVNLYYRTYFPRSGAPRLNDEHLNSLLEMHEKGMSYREIALKIEPELKTAAQKKAATEKFRKRIQTAKRRKKQA